MTRIYTKAEDCLSPGRGADGDNYHREKRHVSPKATHLTGDGADADVGWRRPRWWWLHSKGPSTSYVAKEEGMDERVE